MASSSSEQSLDSDEELQEQFACGELKPGLNVPGDSRQAKKICTNNVAALRDKLTTLESSVDWLERLDVTGECPIEQSVQDGDDSKLSKIHDDFNREMAFYKQALAAVQAALPRLHDLQVATQRPVDYFAEMVKSDVHMKKVRETLLSKQKAMEKSEKARKLREIKKYGKKVQHEILERRHKEKKEALEAVKKYRKDHQQKPDFLKDGGGDEFGVSTTDRDQSGHGQALRKSKKRKSKDGKFGFGGKKRGVKRNSATSSADMSGFKSVKHSMPPRRIRKGAAKKPKRLGKSRRAKQRQR